MKLTKKSQKAGFAFLLIGIVAGGTLAIFAFAVFPLMPWAQPSLDLPFKDFSKFDQFQSFYSDHHNGLDFAVNGTTPVYAPCDLFITEMKCWYNERGGHWQTNVIATLSFSWRIEIAFESWATDEPVGRVQEQAIVVTTWTRVARGDLLGNLLFVADGAHIHFMIKENGNAVCPYPYFTPEAQATLAAELAAINHTVPVCS